MTPREFYRESDAAQQRWQDEAERDLATAWQTASLAKQAMFGKLPSLKTLLDGARVSRRAEQSTEELRQQLTSVLGIPGRPASPATIAAFRRPKETSG